MVYRNIFIQSPKRKIILRLVCCGVLSEIDQPEVAKNVAVIGLQGRARYNLQLLRVRCSTS